MRSLRNTKHPTIPGITTVTVTAGNGSTATYSIKFVHNYLDGWDANGFTDRSPMMQGGVVLTKISNGAQMLPTKTPKVRIVTI